MLLLKVTCPPPLFTKLVAEIAPLLDVNVSVVADAVFDSVKFVNVIPLAIVVEIDEEVNDVLPFVVTLVAVIAPLPEVTLKVAAAAPALTVVEVYPERVTDPVLLEIVRLPPLVVTLFTAIAPKVPVLFVEVKPIAPVPVSFNAYTLTPLRALIVIEPVPEIVDVCVPVNPILLEFPKVTLP